MLGPLKTINSILSIVRLVLLIVLLLLIIWFVSDRFSSDTANTEQSLVSAYSHGAQPPGTG